MSLPVLNKVYNSHMKRLLSNMNGLTNTIKLPNVPNNNTTLLKIDRYIKDIVRIENEISSIPKKYRKDNELYSKKIKLQKIMKQQLYPILQNQYDKLIFQSVPTKNIDLQYKEKHKVYMYSQILLELYNKLGISYNNLTTKRKIQQIKNVFFKIERLYLLNKISKIHPINNLKRKGIICT